MKIIWRVTPDTYERIGHLLSKLQLGQMSEEEWIDTVMRLPGYPLRTRPHPQDELDIRVIGKVRSVPGGKIH